MPFAPRHSSAGVEVEDDAACADSHFRNDALRATDLASGEIGEAECAVIDSQNGDVGHGADRDLSEFGVADLGGGIRGGFANDLIERNAERQDLVHHVGQVEHHSCGGADVEIGGDGVRKEAAFHHRLREREGEGAAAMADIEPDAAFARVEHIGRRFAIGA